MKRLAGLSLLWMMTAAGAAQQQAAAPDGWAGQEGGTRGGMPASAAHTYSASNRAELLAALAGGDSRIVRVVGVIDMSEGRPYVDSADQKLRGAVRLPANTTLLGIGSNAGFVNANVHVAGVEQVVIRNLHFRNPCDVGPVWDPNDGPKGNWNSLFDSITVSASRHVWIDHNSFSDAPQTDDTLPTENGMLRQCHDGALDINQGADLVTVSYNRFAQHEKNTLVGSSDKAAADEGRLRVTFHHNLYEHVASRAPRVRFGKVHLFNNYHAGDRKHAAYAHEYSVGVGKQAAIVSHNNAYDIAGAQSCRDVVRNPGSSPAGVFADSGSLLNGQALADCPFGGDAAWRVPYAYRPLPAGAVREYVLAHAGAGKLAACTASGLRFCAHYRDAGGHWEHGPDGLALIDGAAVSAAGDHYVEAKLRPLGTQPVYLLTRHADAGNWLGAGIRHAGGAVDIEIVRMQDGVMSRLKQVRRSSAGGERFLTLRLELTGTTATLYLDGEKLTAALLAAPDVGGKIGLLASAGNADIGEVRVGDAAEKPARISVALPGQRYAAQAGDPPERISVAAVAGDGTSRLGFTAYSSDSAIATVSAGDKSIVVTARAPGKARIVLTGASDPALQSIVDVDVAPAFAQVPQTYIIGSAVFPAAGAASVPADTPLRIVFDRPPVLGDGGSVRIFRRADGRLAEIIRAGETIDTLGYAGQERMRRVRSAAIRIDGNTAVVKPRRLEYGTDYYVAIDDGVFRQTAIAGVPFAGMGKAAGWRFRTALAPAARKRLLVDDDGPADFRTVQGALEHAMLRYTRSQPLTIDVRNGGYRELLYLRGKDNLTIKGQSRDGVVIHAANSDAHNPGSGVSQDEASPGIGGGRALLLVEDADMLTLDTLTLKNTTLRSDGPSAQAETLFFNSSNGRLIARNASFFSEQDTLQLTGYAWFHRTLVAGNVDFIWGHNRAALFEDSEIRSVGDSAHPASGGYVVQARTVNAADPGFVFLDSRLTFGAGPAGNMPPAGGTYLARSPGTASTWDNVSFIGCRMDGHIAAAGWLLKPAPHPAQASAAAGWREYGSADAAGRPIDVSARVAGYAMSEAEARTRYGSRAAVFAGYADGAGWNPQP